MLKSSDEEKTFDENFTEEFNEFVTLKTYLDQLLLANPDQSKESFLEELQIKISNSENRNKTILQSIQNSNISKTMEIIDFLKFEIKEYQNEIKFTK